MPKLLERFSIQDVEFSMVLEDARLRSFVDWPFDKKCGCTAEKMANAGFYHCPTSQTPDSVRCYSCLIELDGWDPDDDPWQEHQKHTLDKGRHCEFMSIGKAQSEITLGEFLSTMKSRHVNLIKRLTEQNLETFQKESEIIRDELIKLGRMN